MYNNTFNNGAMNMGMNMGMQPYGFNPALAGGMTYGMQQPVHFTNPLGQTKINENLKNGKGLPSLNITQEDYEQAICTHRNPASNEIMAYPLNDGSGKHKCKICGAEFHLIDDPNPEDVKIAAENMWDIGQTAKLMWLDGADNSIKQAFQILALIPKYPALYQIASNTLQRYNGGMSMTSMGTTHPMALMNQIFGGPINGIGFGMPQQPMNMGMMNPMQPMQPQQMGVNPMNMGMPMNPMQTQMLSSAPGMGSNGFGYTTPMQPQQTMQMNLDPNQQVGQPTAQAPQATPQPAPATTATATVTETLHV